jgi:hypothetical protein
MMQKRVGFTLTEAQIERACEAFVAARLLPDEEASAMLVVAVNKTNPITGDQVSCVIEVAKRRKPRVRKKNGGTP